MTDFKKRIEMVLEESAESYAPPGSETKAVIHQWIHALHSESKLFAEKRKVNKKSIIKLLGDEDFFTPSGKFKKKVVEDFKLKPRKEQKFKFIDLFAGIGGMRQGFESAGGVCVFSSEYEKNAQITYEKNYGEFPFGDITKISEKDIPDHDILLAGFPCQPFSHAGVSARNSVGKEHGFKCNTQGTLFFDVMRIVAKKKPKVLFLENVRNIERHDSGRTFEIIKESIKDAGYIFKHDIINSSSEVPQRRIRCYMVCFRKDFKIDFTFPEFTGDALPLKSILEKNAPAEYTISDKLWLGHINRTKRNLERGTGFTAHTANLDKPSNTIVARYGKDGKECLIPQDGKNPRLLTLRECARLQGFQDEFIIPVAKTPAYKLFGNSVVVPVITKIAKKIIKELL